MISCFLPDFYIDIMSTLLFKSRRTSKSKKGHVILHLQREESNTFVITRLLEDIPSIRNNQFILTSLYLCIALVILISASFFPCQPFIFTYFPSSKSL